MSQILYQLGYISVGKSGRIHAVTQTGPLCTTATPRQFIPTAQVDHPTCPYCLGALRTGKERYSRKPAPTDI